MDPAHITQYTRARVNFTFQLQALKKKECTTNKTKYSQFKAISIYFSVKTFYSLVLLLLLFSFIICLYFAYASAHLSRAVTRLHVISQWTLINNANAKKNKQTHANLNVWCQCADDYTWKQSRISWAGRLKWRIPLIYYRFHDYSVRNAIQYSIRWVVAANVSRYYSQITSFLLLLLPQLIPQFSSMLFMSGRKFYANFFLCERKINV